MLNSDLNKHIASFLSPKDVKRLCLVSKSVYSSIQGMMIRGTTVRLSKYNPKSAFKWERLIVNRSKDIALEQVFPKIVYKVKNTRLSIEGVREVTIDYDCREIDWLPNNIQRLTIRSKLFNRPLTRLVDLTHLTIVSDIFNRSIKNLRQLKRLTIISDNFDQSINELVNLTYLKIFSGSFEKPINNLIRLTKLRIRSNFFDQPINNLLNLKELYVWSPHFNQPVNIFTKLYRLYITGHNFNQPVDNPLFGRGNESVFTWSDRIKGDRHWRM